MKPVKFKFSSNRTADCVARHYLLELYLLRIFFGIFMGSTQFMTFSRFAIADSSVREVGFCKIVIQLSILAYATRKGLFTH